MTISSEEYTELRNRLNRTDTGAGMDAIAEEMRSLALGQYGPGLWEMWTMRHSALVNQGKAEPP